MTQLLKTQLHNFQKDTINWMTEHESKYDGGMLLNEAGTGKTLTCLGLMNENPMSTLIICPSGLIENWLCEIKKHTYIDNETVVVYYNQQRHKIIYNDKTKIYITSYAILAKERLKDTASPTAFILNSIFNNKFGRIILDEGHYIRNSRNSIFKAIECLYSEKKWIVTATPIFNSINDLYSYFKFLQLESIDSKKEWNILVKGNNGIMKLHELNKLVEKHSIKMKKSDILSLPKKNIKLISIKTSDFENDFYNALLDYSKNRMKRMILRVNNLKGMKDVNSQSIRKVMCNNIMVYILRLKQCCNSPWLVINKMERLNNIKSLEKATEVLEYFNKSINTDEECPICFDKMANMIISPCGHKYCDSCLDKMKNANIDNCPKCRMTIENIECVETIKNPIKKIEQEKKSYDLKMSSKIKYILKLIEQKIENDEKIVIVSQWISMLDIVREIVNKYFIKKNLQSINLQGNVSIKQRMENIEKFQNDKNIKICYISLMSSAEGINLTNANNMILLDSWWNNSKMIQVIDRLHRIGQNKEVNIYKFIIKNSIEENIQEMINHKSKMANLIINKWNIKDPSKYDDNWIKKIIKLIERNE